MLQDSLITKQLAADVLAKALQTGGDFAEIYVEQSKTRGLTMTNGILERVQNGVTFGCGIRIFNGLSAVYAYTNDLSAQNLLQIAGEAAAAVNKTQSHVVLPFMDMEQENKHIIYRMPDTSTKREIVELLRTAHESAIAYDTLISQTQNSFADVVKDVLIANSNGLWVEDQRVRSRVVVSAVASSETEKQTGHSGPGGACGFELFSRVDMHELGREVSETAITMLKAQPCPGGVMPVVIDNGFGGVIFHEACGHGLEATSVAKNASVFADKLNQPIASACVTAIDDGTIPNAWGSLNVDDEGTPTQKNILIKNGILKSYLIDTLNGKKMNMKSTGSARRESYKYAPTSRMTNTYIDNGNSSMDEIISATDYGLYAKQMGGGSVQPATGEFNFAVTEGYLIRNGKIAQPVRGATLIGKGAEVLLNIDMVGNNLLQAQGMCGSISGNIPTNVGQPTIRVKKLTVGGRG